MVAKCRQIESKTSGRRWVWGWEKWREKSAARRMCNSNNDRAQILTFFFHLPLFRHAALIGFAACNTLTHVCQISAGPIERNLFCFVPFYALYILLMGLQIQFASSTFGIGRRYRRLNVALEATFSAGKLTVLFFANFPHPLAVFDYVTCPLCTLYWTGHMSVVAGSTHMQTHTQTRIPFAYQNCSQCFTNPWKAFC